MNDEICITKVKFGWLNQNPFNSMFWAVQGMVAEFSTGFFAPKKLEKSGKKSPCWWFITKLNLHQKQGRVTFSCLQGKELMPFYKKAIETGEGQTLTMFSEGKDQKADLVSKFAFT